MLDRGFVWIEMYMKMVSILGDNFSVKVNTILLN